MLRSYLYEAANVLLTRVAKWSALSYIVIAGLLLYLFLRNDVSGGTLVILVLSLLVFAIHVPILMGFTVARYAEPSA